MAQRVSFAEREIRRLVGAVDESFEPRQSLQTTITRGSIRRSIRGGRFVFVREARVVAEEAEEKASHALASVDVNAATTTTKAKS